MQVNESINAANLVSIGNLPVKTDKAGENGGMDFASVLSDKQSKGAGVNALGAKKDSGLDATLDSRNTKSADNNIKNTEGKGKEADNVNKTDKSFSKKPEKINDSANKGNDINNDVDNEIIEVEDLDITDVTEISDEVLSAVSEAVMKLFQQIMDEFDISFEEVTDTVSDLSMNVSDLFTNEGAKAFFLELNDAELTDLVVNDELNNKLGDFMELFDFTDEIELPEDFEIAEFVETVEFDNLIEEFTAQDSKQLTMPSIDSLRTPVKEDADALVEGFVEIKDDETLKTVISETDEYQGNDNNDDDKKQESTSKNDISRLGVKANSSKIKEDVAPSNNFMQNFVDAVDQTDIVREVTPTYRSSDIVNQLVEQVKVQMGQDSTALQMQLYPEHLGRIQINVVSKDGVMTAGIVAETEAAKQAIENGLANLREAFEGQNLKVEAVEVMVSTAAFSDQNESKGEYEEGKAGGRKSSKGVGLVADEDEENIDEAEREAMRSSGSSVSYRA